MRFPRFVKSDAGGYEAPVFRPVSLQLLIPLTAQPGCLRIFGGGATDHKAIH